MLSNLRLARTKLSPIFPKPKPFSSSSSSSSPPPVAILRDLHSKPPSSIPLYDAFFLLRLADSSLGPVRFSTAYIPPSSSLPLPSPSPSPLLCHVCGRNFYRHSSLLNHFSIHQQEQTKHLNRINSLRGTARARLAASLSQKIQKYNKVSAEVLSPEPNHGFADELKRAGVKLSDRPLKDRMAEEMDKGRIGCFVLVSDDTGFVPAVREARARRLRTVVVGDEMDGVLRRCADAGFSWKEVILGKARKEAGSAVGKWNDRDLLKRLEWTYKPEEEGSGWEESDGNEDGVGLMKKCDSEPWWKLDGDSEDSVVRSSKL